ncbi:MAG: DUF1272 domain-containing protein [bacterium]|nr:DUF1272 domain-containing protein [bacterium]
MKKQCEKCAMKTGLTDVAYICSYECTFCEACTTAMNHVCPNCKGNLVLRPVRTKSPVQALVSQIKNKVLGSQE